MRGDRRRPGLAGRHGGLAGGRAPGRPPRRAAGATSASAPATTAAPRSRSGRWLLLLNSDAFVRAGRDRRARALRRVAARTPGAVGPRLLWPDGRLQRSCRRFPTVFRLATEYLYLRKLAPRSRILNGFYYGEFAHDEAWRVDWVTGACAARAPRAVRAAGRLRRGVLPLLRGGRPALSRPPARRGDAGSTPPPRSSTNGAAPPGRSLGADARGAGAEPRALLRQARLARGRGARAPGAAGRAAPARAALGAYREAARWLAARPVEAAARGDPAPARRPGPGIGGPRSTLARCSC